MGDLVASVSILKEMFLLHANAIYFHLQVVIIHHCCCNFRGFREGGLMLEIGVEAVAFYNICRRNGSHE